MALLDLSEADVELVFGSDDLELQQMVHFCQTHPLATFAPRPNAPEDFDEQAAFVESEAAVSIAIGGNASGKTEAAAYKLARFVLEKQPPPREDTPFWIISDTYDQCCGVCWFEKLRKYLPADRIDSDRIQWYRSGRQWPYAVPLKPWEGRPGANWVLEFKSYEQGRERMQASSIGGAWFSEQFPFEIFTEVLRGCRDYLFPGGVFAEFTPIDPDLSLEIEERYQSPPPGWRFFRLNTERNRGNLAPEWYDSFFGSISDEMMATRKIGAFASYEGAIFQSFNPAIHLVDEVSIPAGVWHRRAIDWGASAEHPFVCLWAYKNALGQYYFYDEYWNNSQHCTASDHVEAIVERRPWPAGNPYFGVTFADPSRPDLFNEFAKEGLPVQPANNDVLKGIETIRKLLKVLPGRREPRIIIDRNRCPHLAKEMRTYRWLRSSTRGLNPRVAATAPLKRNDDTVDAARYLLHSDSVLEGAKPFSVRTSPRRREGIQLAQSRRG